MDPPAVADYALGFLDMHGPVGPALHIAHTHNPADSVGAPAVVEAAHIPAAGSSVHQAAAAVAPMVDAAGVGSEAARKIAGALGVRRDCRR